jgi:hypothetical protein
LACILAQKAIWKATATTLSNTLSVCPSQVNEVMFCHVWDIIDGFYIEKKNKKIVKITL